MRNLKISKKYNFIFISTADWDNPFWTNKQHMAKILSEQGHKVVYFESLGLRNPEGSSKQDRRRVLKRLIKFFKGPRKVNDNLYVFSPLVIPRHDSFLISSFNNILMKIYIEICFFIYLERNNTIYWTYNPISLDFLKNQKIIYHCVDDLTAAPGLPVEKIRTKELELVRNADLVFVTAPALRDKLQLVVKNKVHYFPNVADVFHFSKATTLLPKPDDLKKIERPILGFIGAISSYKLDFELLLYLSKQLPHAQIVLIGLIGEGQPGTNIQSLKDQKNIHFLGPKDYNVLPQYLKYFDVALLPCALNDYTKSMFPMKFFEYLSAEKKVVSTNLEAIQEFQDCCIIANSYEQFVLGTVKALNCSLEDFCDLNKLRLVTKENTWEERTRKMMKLIEETF